MDSIFAVPVPPRVPLTEWGGLSRGHIEELRRFKPQLVVGLPSSDVLPGFTLTDALVCLMSQRDPRLSPAPAPDWEMLFVEANARWFDDRYVRPGAATIAAEVPSLLPAHRQRWLQYAVYESRQVLLTKTEVVQAPLARVSFVAVERRLREQLAKDVEKPRRQLVLSMSLERLLSELPFLLSAPEHWVDELTNSIARPRRGSPQT